VLNEASLKVLKDCLEDQAAKIPLYMLAEIAWGLKQLGRNLGLDLK